MVLKHLVKSLVVCESDKLSALNLPDYRLKSLYDRAVTLNEKLVKEHNYDKLTPCLDYFRVMFAAGYMPIEEFGKICRKYTVGSNANKRRLLEFRWAVWERYLDLEDTNGQQKQLNLMESELKDGKYKQIEFGRQFYANLLKEQIDLCMKLKKKDIARQYIE